MLDNVRGNLCCPYKYCKNKKKYRIDDVFMSHLIKHEYMEDYQCWKKYGEDKLNEAEMSDLYLNKEVPTGVKEDHDDVNEAYILGLTDDDIVFQVYNIEEMVCNVERRDNDDQYSNDKLVEYKKMIEYSKKSFYHSCAVQYTRCL
jgi:hypothetical protein